MPDKPQKHFLAQIEEELLDTWEKEQTFNRSLENRKGNKRFSFYDGPPFANGVPHYGHLEQTTIKDTITRYKTMQGYYVPRRVGWDTHGLPIEYAIEKKHDFKSKKDIIAYGIDKFNAECRESVFLYRDIWEKMFHRVGRWADYSNSYATLDQDYIESVWWVFKTIYDKGLIYKDFRSSPYCPRCATPLSNFELNQGYQDNIEDPSLFVKFKIKDQDAYLLGWTTTPWSLPGNAAIAVKPEADYVYVQLDSDEGQQETLIMARDRLEILDSINYHVTRELKGSELIGLEYDPSFKLKDLEKIDNYQNLYKVWGAEFVSIDDGSGVLHVAPAFGEDDLMLGKQHSIPTLITVDENGHIKTDLGLSEEFAGKFFKSADRPIIAYLTKMGSVYSAETLLHTYPFCWRCDTPLLYYATDSWLVKVTDLQEDLVNNNQQINWTPNHIKDGRFGKWLQNTRDWAISRNRFWGAPLPVWVTDDGEVIVVGSIDELKERAVNPEMVKELHRPFIDDIEIKTDSGKIAKRIPEVFDCWFESGSMPYAQDHYPFENQDNWDERYPADFVAEAIDQTRGWFYTLHVLGTALFNKPAFQNVICSGWIVAADGEKLSKRKKNYAPMDDIFDEFGVDTLRYFMASSPLVNGEDTRFSTDYLRDVQRKVFMTLNNVYTFYKLYADIDGWKPTESALDEPTSNNILDQWAISRLNEVIGEMTLAMDIYRLDKASRPINDLLDDISNWFVRRSRRRFWKSQDDEDKQQAYATLYYILLRLCQLLAPISPFLSDHLWRELTKGTNLANSVHLSDWPQAGPINETILQNMSLSRESINQGLAQRATAGIKVRQPLQDVTVHNISEDYKDIIAEELNVKEVKFIKSDDNSVKLVVLNTTVTDELRIEGIMRDLVRHIQSARKQAQLNVEDLISLEVKSDDSIILKALDQYIDTIKAETLAISVNDKDFDGYETVVKLNDHDVAIKLSKTEV
jgi:isoleucyl-tRNA synthetase